MEQLTELKQYCFALYWGQRVIKDIDNSDTPHLYPVERSNMYRFEESSLELRPLSSITDKEAIEVAKIVCARHNRHYTESEITYSIKSKANVYLEVKGYKAFVVQICYDGIGFVDSKIQGYGEKNYYAPAQFAATDCLRGFGIALPVYFKGVQYSVDKLTELGIYKIVA